METESRTGETGYEKPVLYRYATRPLNEDSIIKDKESWTGK